MDFELTEEQRLIKKLARDFTKKEIMPLTKEMDQKDEFPHLLLRKIINQGLMAIPIPEEFGGGGCDTLSYVLALEEISKASLAVAITIAVHTSLVAKPICEFGSQYQKEKFLVPLAKGEKLGAFCLTEPNVGSDIASMESYAEFRDNHYFLKGTKIFITNAGIADIYLAFAVTNKQEKDAKKRLSALIIEKGTEGFCFGTRYDKMGWRGSETRELIFNNAEIPPENILGQRDKGFLLAMKILDEGRISVAALGLGLAEGVFETAIKYANERKQFGKNLIEHQAIQFMLADMAMEIEATRHLIFKAVSLKEQKKPYRKESAMAKLFASETAVRAASKALQIHGGAGYMKEFVIERLYRDAKALEIGEGASEIQRMIIAKEIIAELERSKK